MCIVNRSGDIVFKYYFVLIWDRVRVRVRSPKRYCDFKEVNPKSNRWGIDTPYRLYHDMCAHKIRSPNGHQMVAAVPSRVFFLLYSSNIPRTCYLLSASR